MRAERYNHLPPATLVGLTGNDINWEFFHKDLPSEEGNKATDSFVAQIEKNTYEVSRLKIKQGSKRKNRYFVFVGSADLNFRRYEHIEGVNSKTSLFLIKGLYELIATKFAAQKKPSNPDS